MKSNKSIWTAAVLTTAILLLPTTSRASILDVQGTITGATYQYFPPTTNPFPAPGEATESLSVSLPTTLSNISLADYSEIDFDLAPAAGQELLITQPSTLSFYFSYVSAGGSASGPGCSSVAATGTGGTATNSYQLCLIAGNSNSFTDSLQESFPAGYALTDLLLTTSTAGFPVASPGNFSFENNESPDFTLAYSTDTDNGPFAMLTDVSPDVSSGTPEPGTIALLTSGLLGLGAFRLRKR